MHLPLAYQLIANGITYIVGAIFLAILLLAITGLAIHWWYRLQYYWLVIKNKYLMYKLRKEFIRCKVPPEVTDQYMKIMDSFLTQLSKK